jgi:hypothetical protein
MLELRAKENVMRQSRRPIHVPSILLLALALGTAPRVAVADEMGGAAEPVGHVATLFGDVVAERPGEPPRPLHCRDTVYQGERLVTADGSRVGVLVGDVFARLGEGSALRVGHTADAVADISLEQGAVRVVDPRDAGAPARLAVLDARARLLGNDAEAYVFAEKTGAYAMLCEWDAPLAVARDDESAVAQPGKCVIAKRSEPLYLADVHDERLGPPAQDACALGPVIGALDLHLSPADVAAGPLLGPWSGKAGGLEFPSRSPCDEPGSGCVLGAQSDAGLLVVEPPVVIDGFDIPLGGGLTGGTFPPQ